MMAAIHQFPVTGFETVRDARIGTWKHCCCRLSFWLRCWSSGRRCTWLYRSPAAPVRRCDPVTRRASGRTPHPRGTNRGVRSTMFPSETSLSNPNPRPWSFRLRKRHRPSRCPPRPKVGWLGCGHAWPGPTQLSAWPCWPCCPCCPRCPCCPGWPSPRWRNCSRSLLSRSRRPC